MPKGIPVLILIVENCAFLLSKYATSCLNLGILNRAGYNQLVDTTTARQLVELNRQFYADFGKNFSATRQRIQPGVRKIILGLVGTERILDLGCGNGRFVLASALARPMPAPPPVTRATLPASSPSIMPTTFLS